MNLTAYDGTPITFVTPDANLGTLTAGVFEGDYDETLGGTQAWGNSVQGTGARGYRNASDPSCTQRQTYVFVTSLSDNNAFAMDVGTTGWTLDPTTTGSNARILSLALSAVFGAVATLAFFWWVKRAIALFDLYTLIKYLSFNLIRLTLISIFIHILTPTVSNRFSLIKSTP